MSLMNLPVVIFTSLPYTDNEKYSHTQFNPTVSEYGMKQQTQPFRKVTSNQIKLN